MERRTYDLEGEGLREFAKKLNEVSHYIRARSPDYIIAPIIGAVPFVDLLHTVDRKFPYEDVVYLPNSSRFDSREEMVQNWYAAFFDEVDTGDGINLVQMDEVLSGSSASGAYTQFKKALENLARKRTNELGGNPDDFMKERARLKRKIKYHSVGFAEKGHKQGRSLTRLKNKKIVRCFDFDSIPTIDNYHLNFVRLMEGGKDSKGGVTYLPQIASYEITEDYMNMLRDVARAVGADPAKVSPVNLGKIRDDILKGQNLEAVVDDDQEEFKFEN